MRFRKFVKTNERRFIIAGAVLAACSLLLKEVVREDLRDFRDSLSAAKTIFIINTGFISLHNQIGVSHGQTINHAVEPSHNEAESEEEYRIISSAEAFEAEIENMERLLEVMDPSLDDKDMMKGLKQTASAIEADFEQTEKMADEQKKLARLRETEKFSESWQQRSFGWQGKMLSEAEEQERSRDKTYHRVTYLTYVVLIVAAVMGLIGSILNIKGLPATG